MDEKKLARYNLGRKLYQDHLSATNLYQQLPKADEYVGFTDPAVIGFLDMISDDMRTLQERTAFPLSSWHRIDEFCPKGTQIASPGGLSFDLNSITSMTANEDAPTGSLTMNFKGGGTTVVTFHRNTDGGPPRVYELKRNIGEAIKVLNTTAIFLKPDMLEHRSAGGELLGLVPARPAYGPGSITQVMRDKLPNTEKYKEGWNAAIDAILKLSEKWSYHTGREEPPYHLPCINEEHKAEINNLRKRE